MDWRLLGQVVFCAISIGCMPVALLCALHRQTRASFGLLVASYWALFIAGALG